jgi:hypothetical protein
MAGFGQKQTLTEHDVATWTTLLSQLPKAKTHSRYNIVWSIICVLESYCILPDMRMHKFGALLLLVPVCVCGEETVDNGRDVRRLEREIRALREAERSFEADSKSAGELRVKPLDEKSKKLQLFRPAERNTEHVDPCLIEPTLPACDSES